MWKKTVCTTLVTIAIQALMLLGFLAIVRGPRYVLLYAVAVGVGFAVIKRCVGEKRLYEAIIENCATKEQQQRVLSTIPANKKLQ